MHSKRSVLRRSVSRTWVLSILLLLSSFAPASFLLGSLHAQVAGTGSIQGSVLDATGAVVPGASVTLTDAATHTSRNATTDSGGVYNFPNIPVDTYSVSISMPGFKTYEQTNIVLEVGSNIAINPNLQVGSTDQKIEVTTDSLALQTEDPTFKQTIDEKTVTEMPLNGRQMTSLITLAGGASAAPGGDFTGSKYSYATISVSIAGGGGNTTAWRLDGGVNNDYMGNGNLPFPFPDAVNQFSVESTVLGAQSGQHSGGLVNVVTRSGTNTYHGTAFEFIRNPIIDATNYFATGKDTLHQDEFGGTFGGKIIRDKLFAFAGYQHHRAVQAQNSTQAQVPTAANLLGDFSVTDPVATAANPLGSKTPAGSCKGTYSQLLDPLTGAVLPGNKYATPPTYNASSLALQKYLPAIDPTYDTGGCGNVHYSIPSQVFINQFVTRVDYTINPSQHFYARYLYDGYNAPAFYSPTNILITTQSGNREKVQTFTMGEDWTINSSTVNSAHATLLRRLDNRGYNANDINATKLGINLYQEQPVGLYVSATKFTIGGGTNSLAHFNDNTLAFDDDFTMVRGKHTFVFGGEFVRNQLNIFNNYEDNGNFAFGNLYSAYGPTGTKGNSPANVGDSTLDFLMGAQSSFQQSKAQQNALRGSIPSIYAQDTYHPSKRLTLVAGIRWSPNFAPYDYFNRGTAFSMSAFLANQTSSVYPNAPAGALYYGDPGVPRAYTKSTLVQFSPNAGVSFDPFGDGKTVIRGGAELIYDQPNFFTAQRLEDNPPFATAISQVQTSTSGPISFSSPWSAGSITTNPFPQPAVPTPAQAQFFPQSQFIFTPSTFKPSYTIQYTLSVQHQFAHDIEVQLDYIGNGTRHAPLGTPLDAATFVPGVWGAGGTGCAGVVTTGPAGKPAGAAGTACSTVANQAQRFALTEANPLQGNQYLGGGGGTVLVNDNAMANYNGLVTTVQHRLSKTFSVLANWTWSKCMNIADAQGDLASTVVENPNNISMDYAPCGSDYRHIENVVIVARSNFALPRFASLLVNNWELAPLTHIVSGAPFTVTTGVDNSLTDVGNDRPNIVPGADPYLHQFINAGSASINNRGYLNVAAFCVAGQTTCAAPATGTFGNAGRNAFRGPAAYQFDAQVSRIFPIYERLTTTLRLEAFNLLNHPNFSNPTTGLNSSTFGQVSSTSNAARVFQGSLKISF